MGLSLDDLTDEQKALLSQLAYLDFDLDKFHKAKEENPDLKLSDMGDMIVNADETYLGNLTGSRQDLTTKFIVSRLTGKSTNEQKFYQRLIDAGLGDLQIEEIEYNGQSGFDAMCFKDDSGNTGFSFRGTDLSSFKDAGVDVQEYLTDTSKQHEQAQEFFSNNMNSDGTNYVYGHSLGGNLSEHVYLNNYDNIAETFVMNATPIDQRLFVTQGQIDAFNDPDKFKCNIIDGDLVSQLKGYDLYAGNVRYIRNNKNLIYDNFFADHLVESASLGEDGNFVEMPEGETYSGLKRLTRGFGRFVDNLGKIVKGVPNSIRDFLHIRNKEEPLALESGNSPSRLSDDYRRSLNVLSWVGPGYSLEQAQLARNPFEFLSKISHNNEERDAGDHSLEEDEGKVPWNTGDERF